MHIEMEGPVYLEMWHRAGTNKTSQERLDAFGRDDVATEIELHETIQDPGRQNSPQFSEGILPIGVWVIMQDLVPNLRLPQPEDLEVVTCCLSTRLPRLGEREKALLGD